MDSKDSSPKYSTEDSSIDEEKKIATSKWWTRDLRPSKKTIVPLLSAGSQKSDYKEEKISESPTESSTSLLEEEMDPRMELWTRDLRPSKKTIVPLLSAGSQKSDYKEEKISESPTESSTSLLEEEMDPRMELWTRDLRPSKKTIVPLLSAGSQKSDYEEEKISESPTEHSTSLFKEKMDMMSLIPQHSTTDSSFYQQKQMATQKWPPGKTPLHIKMAEDMENVFDKHIIMYSHCLNVRDETGRTPLHIAMDMKSTYHRRQHDAIELLIKKTDVNIQDNTGKTPLHIAMDMKSSYHRWQDYVMELLIKKTDVNIQDNTGRTPLHIALETGPTYYRSPIRDVMKLLINETDVDIQDMAGRTPLHIAVEKSNFKVFESLLIYGPETGQTPLHIALETGPTYYRLSGRDVIEWLINKTDVDIQNNAGRTPLHIAVEKSNSKVFDLLLTRKAEVNVEDKDGRTPLHIAVENSKFMASELLLYGADRNIKDKNGKTPLPTAEEKSTRSVFELLTRGVDVNAQNENGMTLLHIAVEKCNSEAFDVLRDRADINLQDKEGRTPLHIAVEKSNSAAFQMLKDKVNLNLPDRLGRTPIHIAVEASNSEAFEVLKDTVDLNIKDRCGRTPLHTAVECSNSKALEVLIDKVDLSLPDEYGRTPLHTAVKCSNLKALEVLIDKVDLNLPDEYGKTPLHTAVECSNSKALEVLVDKADLNLPDQYGRTPLHTAVKCSNSKALEVLINKADLNFPDKYGKTPLHTAVECSNSKALEVLVDKADLNLPDQYGRTPLHTAVKCSNSKALEVLINKADLNFPDKYGKTPLHTAVKCSNSKALEVLIDKADLNLPDQGGKTPLHIASERYKRHAVSANKSMISAGYYLKEITTHWSFAELLLKSQAKLDIMDAKGATALDVLLSGIGEMKFLPDKRRDHVILLLKAVIWREEYGYIPRIASSVVSEDKEDVFKTILDYTVSEEMLKDRASFIHNTDIKDVINEKESFIQSCLALSSVAKHIDEEDRYITTLFAQAVAKVNIRNIEVCLRSVVNISRKDILYHLREAAWKAKNIEVIESITNIANLSKEEIDSIIEPDGSQEGIVLTPDISKVLLDIAKKDTVLATFISENKDNLIDAYFGTDVTTGSKKQTLVAILKCPPFEKFPDSKGYPLRLTHAFSRYRESIEAEYGKGRKERKVDIPTMMGIKRVVSKYADYMMKNHRNLNIIRRSSVISKAKSGTVKEEDCILLSCYAKGVIPDGDLPFPTSLEGIAVDVREGAFSLYAGTGGTHDATRGLKMGCMISKSVHDNCGTLGGFVQAGEDLCFLTCAHVLHDVDSCVNSKSYAFTEQFEVMEAGSTFTTCGDHVRSVLDLQSDITVDASLVKICQQRLPNVGQFIYIPDQFSRRSGFSGAPVFNNGRCEFDINTQRVCIKIGALSGITRGLPDVYGTVARQQEHIIPHHNQRLVYKGQFEIPATRQQPFAIPGDSGALVFSVDQVTGHENPTLACVGMVVGGTSDFITLVTPIREVLKKLGLNTDTLAVFNEEMEVDG